MTAKSNQRLFILSDLDKKQVKIEGKFTGQNWIMFKFGNTEKKTLFSADGNGKFFAPRQSIILSYKLFFIWWACFL